VVLSSPPLPATALAAWQAACLAAGCPALLPAERVALADAVGRVTAEPVVALRSSPAHQSAAMDGIAVRAVDTVALRLAAGAYDVVDTGDAIPAGRDAVVVREQVTYDGRSALLQEAVPAGRHVRAVGEDVRAGEQLLPAGHRLRPVDVAWAAGAGYAQLLVRRRPHVVVIPTGDEVLPVGSVPGPGEVLDTNSLMLVGQAVEAGCTAEAVAVVPDQPLLLAAALHTACVTADLVVVGAGSSAGRDDHTAAVVAALGELVVQGVAVRPGHPVVLGVVDRTPVLGAPGYPVSTALTFDLLAVPLLAALVGAPVPRRPRVVARLTASLVSPVGADDWVRLALSSTPHGPVATVLRGGAGALSSLARADALLLVPAGVAGHAEGDPVEVELLR